MDITQLILDDHAEQRRLFSLIEQIGADNVEALEAVWGRQSSRALPGAPKRASSASRTVLTSSGAQVISCPSSEESTFSAPASSAASNIVSASAAVAG